MTTQNEDGDLVLDGHDRASAMYRKLDAHLRARLAHLRRKNDDGKLTGDQTAALRGQIVEVKAMLRNLSATGSFQD